MSDSSYEDIFECSSKNQNQQNRLESILIISSCLQLVLVINFSSRTTSMDIQRNLETNVEKRTKDTFGPPMGKRLLVFMDDMNMPRVSCQYFCQVL